MRHKAKTHHMMSRNLALLYVAESSGSRGQRERRTGHERDYSNETDLEDGRVLLVGVLDARLDSVVLLDVHRSWRGAGRMRRWSEGKEGLDGRAFPELRSGLPATSSKHMGLVLVLPTVPSRTHPTRTPLRSFSTKAQRGAVWSGLSRTISNSTRGYRR